MKKYLNDYWETQKELILLYKEIQHYEFVIFSNQPHLRLLIENASLVCKEVVKYILKFFLFEMFQNWKCGQNIKKKNNETESSYQLSKDILEQ